MKLVFPILRMNWYRVIASSIDAALAEGHEVECWHYVGGDHWPANRPCKEKVPAFSNGTPLIRDYEDDAEFIQFCSRYQAEAILSISLVWESLLPRWLELDEHPPWVILATNDTFFHCNRPEQLLSCDVITVRSPHEKSCLLFDHTRNLDAWYEQVHAHPRQSGSRFLELSESRRKGTWTEEMVEAFEQRCVATGYPLLDTVSGIDLQELRQRWGIPEDQAVVGCLASPFGTVLGADWEKGFVSRNPLGRLFWSLRRQGLSGMKIPPNEVEVMQALRRYCDRNDAFLLLKMRHSQTADPVMLEVADRILGEESYYPHTAVEMACLATVTFGFYTTGAPEAVAAGHPFVDLRIPGYNHEDWIHSATMFDGLFTTEGVTHSIPALEWVKQLSQGNLEQFACKHEALGGYHEKFCGPMDGKHSLRVIRAVEAYHRGEPVSTDEKGFVAL